MLDTSPARVALVMSYPYEAFRGGEESYVAALRRYLVGRGHRVDTLFSDVTRGRVRPVLHLPAAIRDAGRLRVRRAFRLGEERFVSFDPRLLGRSAGALLGRRPGADDHHGAGEEAWLLEAIRKGGYDAVILMWGASRYALPVSELCDRVLALQGFCTDYRLHLGKETALTIPPDILEQLGGARLVGMNNAAETAALRRLLPASEVIQVGMGFDERQPLPVGDEPLVLFVGANSGPNQRALAWLLDAVWPIVAAVRPDARLRVVGAVAEAWRDPVPVSVDMLGRVQSLEGQYRSAQVVVAPLVTGSAGVKIKVAEALSYGRPLVSTSVGVDPGDPGQFGAAVEVADEPKAFAEAVCRLLGDSDMLRSRAALAQDAFRANFSKTAAYGALSERLAL